MRGLFTGHWVFSLVSLLALALYSWAIRYFLVEYVGDVAIYVSSYRVSRFEEVRKAIQAVAFSVLQQEYSSRDRVGGEEGADTYSEVVLVGHSLGFVIAYDALNAAISWDSVEKSGRMNVVRRTRRLITFGSPLDKTAFLFRTQVSGPRFLRESLGAQTQPLILDYRRFRPCAPSPKPQRQPPRRLTATPIAPPPSSIRPRRADGGWPRESPVGHLRAEKPPG